MRLLPSVPVSTIPYHRRSEKSSENPKKKEVSEQNCGRFMDCPKISRNIHSHTGIVLLVSEKCVFRSQIFEENVLNRSCKTRKNVFQQNCSTRAIAATTDSQQQSNRTLSNTFSNISLETALESGCLRGKGSAAVRTEKRQNPRQYRDFSVTYRLLTCGKIRRDKKS